MNCTLTTPSHFIIIRLIKREAQLGTGNGGGRLRRVSSSSWIGLAWRGVQVASSIDSAMKERKETENSVSVAIR